MALRFMDTNYFKSPFVRSMEAPLKLLYSFIICDCSPAGIWPVDIEIASVYCGVKIDEKKAYKAFIESGKAVDLKNGKWFLPGFIEHQYPKGLSATNPAHNNIIIELKDYNLLENDLSLKKELTSPFNDTKQEHKSPSKGTKDMVIVMEEGKETGKRFSPPTEKEVVEFFVKEKNIPEVKAKVYAKNFWEFYEKKNWMVGKNKMSKWKIAAASSLNWDKNDGAGTKKGTW